MTDTTGMDDFYESFQGDDLSIEELREIADRGIHPVETVPPPEITATSNDVLTLETLAWVRRVKPNARLLDDRYAKLVLPVEDEGEP